MAGLRELERVLSDAGLELGRRGAGSTGRLAGALLLVGGEHRGGLLAPVGDGSSAPTPAPSIPQLAAAFLAAADPQPAAPEPSHRGGGARRVGDWVPSWTDREHRTAIEQVRTAIARGDVYQANVVGHRHLDIYSNEPISGFVDKALRSLFGRRGGTLVHPAQGWSVHCASPESVLEVGTDRVVRSRPIKGTDRDAARLRTSGKDRAEHVMIVDLVRNDLARIARSGTVTVEELYGLRRWADLWQAESTVRAELGSDVGLADLLGSVLPAGSVTGAPKQAAVDLLARLEPVGRGPAMGALGYLRADGSLTLSLTIRTVAVEQSSSFARMHLWAGGGITWGSDPGAEVAEAHSKAAPLLAALDAAFPVATRA